MIDDPEHTELFIDGVIVPIRAAFVHDEDWEAIGEVEEHETWDGESDIVDVLFKRKYRITISVSGEPRMPALSKKRAGDIMVMHSRRWMDDSIPAGATQTILERPVSKGQIYVREVDTDEAVECTVSPDGLTVTIDHPAPGPMGYYVQYRPKLTVRLVSFGAGSYSVENGTSSWSLVAREKSAPA